MTSILGISAFYHDSAAALVVDGRIVAAAQEERFTRKKHDPDFPTHAIEYCLAEGRLSGAELDYVAFYDKPLLKFDRLLETHLSFAPAGFRAFLQAMPVWLRRKLHLPRIINKGLGGRLGRRCVFAGHHESHAASAFFPSPFDEAAILTFDGVGEWATAAFGAGRDNKIALTHELHFPHSPGLLYSAFTYFCGFRVNSGEYKLMGLAPYGEAKYADLILEKLVDLKADGSFRMDQSYFNYCGGLTMTSRKFAKLFGGPPRRMEGEITQREMDLAASIQKVIEEIMLRAVRHVHERTGMLNLCLAGGVALNCVGNGRILREGPFERLWIQPAAGDAGGAVGAALLVWHQLLDRPRTPTEPDSQQASLLGPAFTSQQVRDFLDARGAAYRRYDSEDELRRATAELIAAGKVVGWMRGRMEFGPRALGNRSILADPRDAAMQSRMNRKIKFRESFRPFAPAVLRERAYEFFQIRPGDASPYMLLVAPLAEAKRTGAAGADLQGFDKLKANRSVIPAVTHVDYSARLQTVEGAQNPAFHKLLKAFEAATGCPLLINTSFNVRGEPIVCTPQDAWQCFMATGMDALVMEDVMLLKDEQPGADEHRTQEYLGRFEMD